MLHFTFVFLLLIPATSSLSFNMSSISFSDSSHFNITGDASISDQGIQVTPNEPDSSSSGGLAGRAIYSEPLHLWDEASRNLTDFYTHFSFLIDSNGTLQPYYGDGLAFFLAPLGSSIPSGSRGGGLGLGDDGGAAVSSFVAVEFDTFLNPNFDPSYVPHVGIDINSVKSVATAKWENNISYGVTNDVWISYTASSRLLRADFTGNTSNGTQRGSLSYEVDLRDHLPEYVAVGFSAATGVFFEQHNVKSWDFSSTLQSNSTDLGKVPKKKNKALEALKFLGGLLVILLIPLWCLRKNKTVVRAGNECGALFRVTGKALLWLWSILIALLTWMWNKSMALLGGDSSMDKEFINGTGPRKFSHEELARATANFKEKLGEGGFGKVYKGFLKEKNEYIAVKRVSKKSKQGKKEYEAEVKIISQLRHVNLVRLIGWCHQRRELLLVYEFMPNGSLDSHLFREIFREINPPLSWEMRYGIALGVAKALLYLHEELNQYVVHRDIKSSNIMLDSEFVAKLGDFGLARFVDRDEDFKTTRPAGTPGYMDPEHWNGEKASKASDIYSFGIVLLEIICGRRVIVIDQEQLVVRVRRLNGDGRLLDAVDTKLGALSESDATKLQQLLVVGLKCADRDPDQRPTIGEVVQDLNFVLN